MPSASAASIKSAARRSRLSGRHVVPRLRRRRARTPLFGDSPPPSARAQDRPAADGIARERELLAPLRRGADYLIDSTDSAVNDLQQQIRARFGGEGQVSRRFRSCRSVSRAGCPRNADLVFDMRFLRNPHWEASLRPLTGLDSKVAAYVAGDPAYETAVDRIEELLAHAAPALQRAKARRMSPSRSAVPAGDTARFTWPRRSPDSCARVDFRPRLPIVTWRLRRGTRRRGCRSPVGPGSENGARA